MAGDDNLIHVREHGNVVKVLDHLIKNGIAGNVGREVRILIVCAGRPLRSFPDKTVADGTASRAETINPRIANVLTIAVGKVRSDDSNVVEIDGGVRDLRESTEHVGLVGAWIFVEAVDDDDSAFDIGGNQTLAIGTVTHVVDERNVVGFAVFDLPECNLRVANTRETVLDWIAHVLLGIDKANGGHQHRNGAGKKAAHRG